MVAYLIGSFVADWIALLDEEGPRPLSMSIPTSSCCDVHRAIFGIAKNSDTGLNGFLSRKAEARMTCGHVALGKIRASFVMILSSLPSIEEDTDHGLKPKT